MQQWVRVISDFRRHIENYLPARRKRYDTVFRQVAAQSAAVDLYYNSIYTIIYLLFFYCFNFCINILKAAAKLKRLFLLAFFSICTPYSPTAQKRLATVRQSIRYSLRSGKESVVFFGARNIFRS